MNHELMLCDDQELGARIDSFECVCVNVCVCV